MVAIGSNDGEPVFTHPFEFPHLEAVALYLSFTLVRGDDINEPVGGASICQLFDAGRKEDSGRPVIEEAF